MRIKEALTTLCILGVLAVGGDFGAKSAGRNPLSYELEGPSGSVPEITQDAVLLLESFDTTWSTTNPPPGWQIVYSEPPDDNDWHPRPYVGGGYRARIYETPVEVFDNILISPVIDCSRHTNVKLSVWTGLHYSVAFNACIEGSTDGGATWPFLVKRYNRDVFPGMTERFDLNWAEGKGAVRLRWFAGGTNAQAFWYVDDVLVEGDSVVERDAGAREVYAPAAKLDPGVVAPKCGIRNLGRTNLSNVLVYCVVDSAGTSVYAESVVVSGPLTPFVTVPVVFPGWRTGPAGNTYRVIFFTRLAADGNPRNDTVMTTVYIRPNPEDTLHVDGPYDDAVGLSSGGMFYAAARLTPELGCNLIALIFYHEEQTQNEYAFVWRQNTPTRPGTVVESIPYSGSQLGWVRCNLGAPFHVPAGQDVWVGVRFRQGAGQYPCGVDEGPQVPGRGGWINYLDRWLELRTLNLDCNWNIRAIVLYEGGVEEKVLVPKAQNQKWGGATIVRGSLHLPFSSASASVSTVLVTATGRQVMELAPGENDVSRLAPGVYFVREAKTGKHPNTVRKVIVQR